MSNKMTGNQEVVKGFDLHSFVQKADDTPAPDAKQTPKKMATPKPVGKPPKPPAERLSERVQITLTPDEFKKIEDQAGMVPISRYLRKFLQDNGLI